jgi:hypothetical protein
LCLEDEGMSQICLISHSFEVDACTLCHRIDFSKNQLAWVGSVLILKFFWFLVFVTQSTWLWLLFPLLDWWLVTIKEILSKSLKTISTSLSLSLSQKNQELSIKLDCSPFFQEISNIWINIISISPIQSLRKRKEPKIFWSCVYGGHRSDRCCPPVWPVVTLSHKFLFLRLNWKKSVP